MPIPPFDPTAPIVRAPDNDAPLDPQDLRLFGKLLIALAIIILIAAGWMLGSYFHHYGSDVFVIAISVIAGVAVIGFAAVGFLMVRSSRVAAKPLPKP